MSKDANYLKKYIDSEEIWDEVPRVFFDVDGLLFHSTSENGLIGIINDKAIKPYDGTFPARWKVSKDSTTYGLKNKYVCLFDFYSVPIKYKLKFPSQWYNVVLCSTPFNFLIELDYEFLRDNLIPNEVAVKETNYSIKFIPYVESWYTQSVPISAFKNIIVMQNFVRNEDHFAIKLKINDSLFKNISLYKNKIISRYKSEYDSWLRLEEIFNKN